MVKTIDMQDMRYLNLFERITGVRTRFCFKYNEYIIFCVPKYLVSRAVGNSGKNIRKMSEILGRKIRIISAPKSVRDADNFIRSIVNPLMIKGVEADENEVVISGGKNKAALIGRNKRRLLEMQKIVRDFFSKEVRIA
jgi:transcription antitermination factor NusA-like protein